MPQRRFLTHQLKFLNAKIKESPLKSVLKRLKKIWSFGKEKIKLLYFVAYYLGINIDSVHYFSGECKSFTSDVCLFLNIPGSHSVIFFNLLVKVFCPLSGFFFTISSLITTVRNLSIKNMSYPSNSLSGPVT